MILITGGSGYLGGRLAEFLSNSQIKKIAITVRKESKTLRKKLPNCDVRILDITKPDNIKKALTDITDVIHLISLNAKNSAESPELAEKINAHGTLDLVKTSLDSGVKRFIYISTAHVYGAPLVGEINEMTPALASHPYATSHLQAEKYIKKAAVSSDTKFTILRLSNAVGNPIMKDTDCWMLVVNDICKQIVTSQTMRFSSQRNIERDYISIEEICRTISYILCDETNNYEGIYNFGSGKSISLESLANLISERAKVILGIDARIYFPNQSSEPTKPLSYSISKIQREGITISNSLNNEIDKLLIKSNNWFKEGLN